jgi:hypothetical protein
MSVKDEAWRKSLELLTMLKAPDEIRASLPDPHRESAMPVDRRGDFLLPLEEWLYTTLGRDHQVAFDLGFLLWAANMYANASVIDPDFQPIMVKFLYDARKLSLELGLDVSDIDTALLFAQTSPGLVTPTEINAVTRCAVDMLRSLGGEHLTPMASDDSVQQSGVSEFPKEPSAFCAPPADAKRCP